MLYLSFECKKGGYIIFNNYTYKLDAKLSRRWGSGYKSLISDPRFEDEQLCFQIKLSEHIKNSDEYKYLDQKTKVSELFEFRLKALTEKRKQEEIIPKKEQPYTNKYSKTILLLDNFTDCFNEALINNPSENPLKLRALFISLLSYNVPLKDIILRSLYIGAVCHEDTTDITDLISINKTLAPFHEDELRNNVCRDKLFPDEHIYLKRNNLYTLLGEDLLHKEKLHEYIREIYIKRNLSEEEKISDLQRKYPGITEGEIKNIIGQKPYRVPFLFNSLYSASSHWSFIAYLDKLEDKKFLSDSGIISILKYTSTAYKHLNLILNEDTANSSLSINSRMANLISIFKDMFEKYLVGRIIIGDKDLKCLPQTEINEIFQFLNSKCLPALEIDFLTEFPELIEANKEFNKTEHADKFADAKSLYYKYIAPKIPESFWTRLYDDLSTDVCMLSEALDKIPKVSGIAVYRGMVMNNADFKKIQTSSEKVFEDFTSASVNENEARIYSIKREEPEKPNKLLFEINLTGKGCVCLENITMNPEFRKGKIEFVIIPGTKVKIDSIIKHGNDLKDILFIKCTEV